MSAVTPDSQVSAEYDPRVAATTMCEAFQHTAAVEPDEIALRSSDAKLELTWGQYAERVRSLAGGLASLGVGRGNTVALMMGNRPEFHLADTASFHLGAIPFSIYNTSSPEQIAHLMGNAANRVIIAEASYLDRILAARGNGAEPASVVLLDGTAEGTITLEELEQLGAANDEFDFGAVWRGVDPDDVLTLIYTSGTTGPPKGVELTHANLLADCQAAAAVLPVRRGARITSYLPHAHIADRWSSHYNSIVYGVQVTTIADHRAVAGVLPSLKPTIWGAVPRVVEKIKAGLEAAVAADPDESRRTLTESAIATGIEVARLREAGDPIPEELAARHAAADEHVLSKLRAKLGLDQAEWIIIGAAPLTRPVYEFLAGIGLPITELFGMSECSCCVSTVLPAEAKLGSVGRVLPGIEVKLAHDGELLVRGATIMRGYRNNPEQTADALDSDGYLRTGDIATIDAEGYIRIVDRKKELIISAGGKNMSPANIESELKAGSPLIGQAATIGDGRPYNVALIVLDPDAASADARRLGLEGAPVSELAAHPSVRQAVQAGVARANERLSRVEQIKRFELLGDEWLPGGDELTPTMKLKRKPIAEKYAAVIEQLYSS